MVVEEGGGDERVGNLVDWDDIEGRREWMRWSASRRALRQLNDDEGVEVGRRAVELRLSLHLNVAAVALRLEDWELAESACIFVLRR